MCGYGLQNADRYLSIRDTSFAQLGMAGRMSVFLNPKKQISAEYGTTNNEFTGDPFFPGIILLRYFKEYWHFLYDISGRASWTVRLEVFPDLEVKKHVFSL